MNSKKKNELKVGIVALLAIVIFVIGVSLGKGVSVSVSDQKVKFRFDNSGGITEGSPIVVNGVRRGTVKSVANDNGSVLITADMNNISDIKSDAIARITILEITGGKKIELDPGTASANFNLKNEIPGRATADIADLVAILGEVSGNAASLVRNLDTLAIALNTMMADGKLATDVAVIADNTAELTANLNNLMKDNYTLLQNSINNLNSLLAGLKRTFDKHEPNVDKLIAELDQALSGANSLLGKIEKTIEKADQAVADLKDITGEVKLGSGLANRLIYDKSLASSMDSTLKALGILVNKINDHGVNVNVRLGTRP